jgi:hypothetical protein
MGGVGKHRQDSTVLLPFTVPAEVTKGRHRLWPLQNKNAPRKARFKREMD